MVHSDVGSKTRQGKERRVDIKTLSLRHGVVVDHLKKFEISIPNGCSEPIKRICLVQNV